MSSWVLAQTLVLLSSDVIGPLQDRDAALEDPSELGFRDPTSDAVGTGLWEPKTTHQDPHGRYNAGATSHTLTSTLSRVYLAASPSTRGVERQTRKCALLMHEL